MIILAEKLQNVPFWAMTPEEVGKRVKQIRKRLGVSQYEVAKRGEIQQAVYMRVERGETNPTLETLSKVCRGLGVSLGELVGSVSAASGVRDREVVVAFPRTQAERDKLSDTVRPESYAAIPLLADAASLGPGLNIEDADIEDYCLVTRDLINKGGKHFAIKVKGDSMKPTLEDGNIVVVDLNDITPKSLRGKVIAAKVGDGVTIKRFQVRDGDKPWYFQADNAEWEREHGQITSKAKDGLILGKVVWAWRRMG